MLRTRVRSRTWDSTDSQTMTSSASPHMPTISTDCARESRPTAYPRCRMCRGRLSATRPATTIISIVQTTTTGYRPRYWNVTNTTTAWKATPFRPIRVRIRSISRRARCRMWRISIRTTPSTNTNATTSIRYRYALKTLK